MHITKMANLKIIDKIFVYLFLFNIYYTKFFLTYKIIIS